MQVPRMIRIEHVDCEELLEELLQDFVANFEAARGDRVFQQLMISAPPVSTGSAFADGLIAAIAEHLARLHGLRVPSWVGDSWRSGPTRFSTTRSFLAGTGDEVVPHAFFIRNIAGSWARRLSLVVPEKCETAKTGT